MIYRWHRALDSVIVNDSNPKFCSTRPYLYEIPVLREDLGKYLDYPHDDDMAISLTLGKRNDNHYPELLLKRTCWLVKNLCEWTDLAESGTRLVFSVDTKLEGLALRYFEACNFPMSNVNWFDSNEGENSFSSKFDAVMSDVFKPFKRVFHMDLACRVGNHPTQYQLPLFSRIKKKWGDELFAQAGPLLRDRKIRINSAKERGWWKYRRHALSEYIGWGVENEERYWDTNEMLYYIGGMMMGFHRRLLNSPTFNQEILPLNSMSDDELAMCYYARKHNWTDLTISDFSDCFEWGGFDPAHLTHYTEAPFIHYQHINSIGEVQARNIHENALY